MNARTVLRRTLLLFAASLLVCILPHAHAQGRESSLSDAEVEKLRDRADDPPERIAVFMGFLDDRTRAIEKLDTGKRKPGREEDLHDQIEQFTSIAADLDDNLDDYAKRNKDVRKALPKLLKATERWETALKTPPEDQAYKVARTLALQALADVRESAAKLLEEQKAYFLAHPPTTGSTTSRRPES